jgi:hypothetical protein
MGSYCGRSSDHSEPDPTFKAISLEVRAPGAYSPYWTPEVRTSSFSILGLSAI